MLFFFSSRRRHTRFDCDWSSDVCSSDLEMRGRVSAVNSVFIDVSNELGGFESGALAALVGPVTAVVAGGVGTIVVVSAVALAWPELRKLETLQPVGPTKSLHLRGSDHEAHEEHEELRL